MEPMPPLLLGQSVSVAATPTEVDMLEVMAPAGKKAKDGATVMDKVMCREFTPSSITWMTFFALDHLLLEFVRFCWGLYST